MMKQITLFVFLLSTIICCNAANEANCDVNSACKKGTYITLDGKKYNYSVAMGVKHSNTEEMTIKCITNSSGNFVAPSSVELHCTNKALWCSQKHNTGDRLVISCYNSNTSGDSLHLKIDKVDCKEFITGDNASNATKIQKDNCTWGSITWDF